MRLIIRSFFVVVLVATTLICVVFLSSDIQQQWIRPWLTNVLSQRLQADVQIGSLSFSTHRIDLTKIAVTRGQDQRIRIDQLHCNWLWQGLSHGQVQQLQIDGVDLYQNITPSQGSTSAGFTLPVLPVKELSLDRGTILLNSQGRQLKLQKLELQLNNGAFKAQGKIGPEELSLLLKGHIQPGEPAQLRIEEWQLDEQEVLQRPVSIRLADSDQLDGLHLQLERLTHKDISRWARAFDLPSPLPADIAFSLNAPRIALTTLDPLKLDASFATGEFSHKDLHIALRAGEAKLTKEEDWSFSVRLADDMRTEISSQGTISADRWALNAQATVPQFQARLVRLFGLSTLPLSGGLQVSASARKEPQQAITSRIHWQGIAADKAATVEGVQLSGLSGQIDLQLNEEDLDILTQTRLPANASVDIYGTPQTLQWDLKAPNAGQLSSLVSPAWWPALADGMGSLYSKGTLRIDPGRVSGSGTWQSSGWADQESAVTKLRGSLAFKSEDQNWDLGLKAIDGHFSIAETTAGRLALNATLKSAGNDLSLSVTPIKLSHIEAMSKDGLSGFSGGALELSGGAVYRPNQPLVWNARGNISINELLHDAFYAETAETPAQFDTSGTCDLDNNQWQIKTFNLSLLHLLSAQLKGDWSPAEHHLEGTLNIFDLNAAPQRYINTLLAGLLPEPEELTLNGQLSIAGRWQQRGQDWQLKAVASPKEAGINWPARHLSAAGISGTIPITLSASPSTEKAATGNLSLQKLALGPVKLQTLSWPITTADNGVSIMTALHWHLLDGELVLDHPSVTKVASAPALSVGIEVNDVPLASLARELEWPSMQGNLSASLGRIRYQSGRAESDGVATIDTFGGQILVQQMKAENPLGAFPGFEADIKFTGLDLQALTQTLEFGEMRGIIDGHVRNLRFLGHEPSRFEARVETRPDKPRTISVRAIDNLSVVSQGSTSFLNRGIYRFIPRYNYRKLGLECRLMNDRFNLRGVARKDSTRYLVDGGLLPPKIDVVSAEAQISFKELLSRLQRIDRSGE